MTLNRGLVVVSERLGALTADEGRLGQAGFLVRSAPLWNVAEIETHAGDAVAIILGAVEPFDAAALQTLRECRVIVRRGAGYDNVDTTAATALGIAVATIPDASVEEVSDHALALLLSIERRIVELDRAVRRDAIEPDLSGIGASRSRIRRMSQLTLGIVGFGRIGQALARKARTIYKRILVADPQVTSEATIRFGAELADVNTVLREADHVSLHVPLVEQTRNMINDQSLAQMRHGAVVVNTSRGGVIDEQALARAIEAGRLGGAGLDVTAVEPIRDGHALLQVDRTVLTGHSAMASAEAQAEVVRRSVDLTLDLLDCRSLNGIINTDVLAVPQLRLSCPDGQPRATRGDR